MGLKKTLEWARTEWGILCDGRNMSWAERMQWLQQWVPFSVRTMGFGLVSVTLGPLTGGAASTWSARRWSVSSARGLRIDIRVSGQENVVDGGFVYASNHESMLDILVLGASLPGDFKWAAKRSLMNVPFLGWHLRLAGHVPVDRGKGKDAALAVTTAFESVLRADYPLLVFPEGTRTRDGKLRAFKKGAFQAAVNTGKPIVPVALDGTFTLMSRDAVDTGSSIREGPRPVTVTIGAPRFPDPELGAADAVSELRDRTQETIRRMLEDVRAKSDQKAVASSS